MTTYTVEKGDTLGKVAHKYFGTHEKWRVLAEYNDLIRPDLIGMGDLIEIPPWEPQVFRFPLEIEKDYYKFGDLYAVGPWKGKPHPGVDLHQYEGASIYPIGEGVVCRNSFDSTGYGWYVMIEHRLASGQKLWSLYAHLQVAPLWSEGETILGSDLLGLEGTSGAAGIPHLHLELKRTRKMGLYPQLTLRTLINYFYDPYFVIGNSDYLCLPVQCWGCLKVGCDET